MIEWSKKKFMAAPGLCWTKRVGSGGENDKHDPTMHLADVEKCMVALLDDSYLRQFNIWLGEDTPIAPEAPPEEEP